MQRWLVHSKLGITHLFNNDDDEVEQLWAKKWVKMINEVSKMLISGAERNNDCDSVSRDAPERYWTSSGHQLISLRLARPVLPLLMFVLRKMRSKKHPWWYLRSYHFIPRQISVTIHAHHLFYKFTESLQKPRYYFSGPPQPQNCAVVVVVVERTD